MKSIRNTAKWRIINAISLAEDKGITREDAERIIWEYQGHDAPFERRPGYYSTNFAQWKREGLFRAEKRGIWTITPLGELYANSETYSEAKFILSLARSYRKAQAYDRIIVEWRELRYENARLKSRISELERESSKMQDIKIQNRLMARRIAELEAKNRVHPGAEPDVAELEEVLRATQHSINHILNRIS